MAAFFDDIFCGCGNLSAPAEISCSLPFPEDAGREAAHLLEADDPAVNAAWLDGELRISCGSSRIDSVAEILSAVMKRYALEEIVTFEAAYASPLPSGMRPGGIAAAVGAGHWRIVKTAEMVNILSLRVRMAQLEDSILAKPGADVKKWLQAAGAMMAASLERRRNSLRAIGPAKPYEGTYA